MVNLLPQENRVAIKKEYFRRLIVVCGVLTSFIFLIVIVLLAPSFLLIWDQEASFKRQLEYTDQILASSETKQLAEIAKDTNKKIDRIVSQIKASKVSTVFNSLLAIKGEEIKIRSFSLTNENKAFSISIAGNASTRTSLLSFIDRIEKEFPNEKIDSPASNLLKDKDVDFSIMIQPK